MRIKSFFIILSLILLALSCALAYWATHLPDSRLPYYIMEGTIAFILIYLIVFYNKIVKPMHTIGNGMELLREQDFSSRLSPVGQHEADRIVNIFNRMMDQLKNERLRLREQNHFLDLLIQASPMGVIITDLDGNISQANPMAIKMLGIHLESLLNKPIEKIDSPLATELAALSKEETRVVRLNDANIYRCTFTFFIDRGFQHPFYLIERMTDEVIRAEKKAYEKVIRMIAHEVKTAAAGITSTLDTVEQALATEKDMEEICDVMHVCTERCFSMSKFITRFADVVKIPEPLLSRNSLNETATTCVRFMEGLCNDHHIQLTLQCAPDVGDVNLDTSLFEQVLVNIIKNAVESIGQDGEIRITTTAPASLEVADNGPGISKETEEKLFSPFFSTKPHGQGIGLIFIREVLNRHGCTFSLRTYNDGWTRFRISFP